MSPQKLLDEALAAADLAGDEQTIAYVTVTPALTQAVIALTAEIHQQNELTGRALR